MAAEAPMIPTAFLGPPVRPTARFMLTHPAHLIALGFGSGLSPVAPGTVGTLWGWATFIALRPWLSSYAMGVLLVCAIALGWWACTVTARNLRVADPGCIVWDEIVTIWLILLFVMPARWDLQLAAFVIFRFFDTVKPGPIRWADTHFKASGWRGGFGILLDDLLAGACTLLVIAFWKALIP